MREFFNIFKVFIVFVATVKTHKYIELGKVFFT